MQVNTYFIHKAVSDVKTCCKLFHDADDEVELLHHGDDVLCDRCV